MSKCGRECCGCPRNIVLRNRFYRQQGDKVMKAWRKFFDELDKKLGLT